MRLLRPGHLAILAALAAAAVLVGVELQRDALAEGRLGVPDPCTRAAPALADGVDAQAQRIGLSAVDSAACRLGTTREELILSVAGTLEDSGALSGDVETALRDGLQDAIEAEADADRLNTVAAWLLRQAAGRAPVDWIVRAVEEIGPRVT
jgi:hypothetical protein